MNYCLNTHELERVLLFFLKDKAIEDEDLKLLLDNADQWQDKLICLTLSFARVLEKRRDNSPSFLNAMISELFSMPEKMFMDVQECGEDFVDYMLRNEPSDQVDLESLLQTVAKRLSEHYYGKETLRD